MAFKTEAIVLHYRVLKGADRMYEILTPHDGRLSIIARSAGKSSSKMAGHLEPFAHVRVMIGRGKDDHLAGVATITSYAQLRETWSDFILTSSLVELLLAMNVPGIDTRAEFIMLKNAFDLLVDHKDDARAKVVIGRIFLWKYLTLAGWRPNLEVCAECRKPFVPSEAYYRPISGFVCAEHAHQATRLDPHFLDFLEQVVTENDWKAIISSAGSNGLHKQWLEVSQRYYQDVINKPIQSLKLFAYV